jgi:Lar family restriction alleviation protein
MSNIKNCPFCGNEGLLARECTIPDEDYVMYYILCNSETCDTHTGKFFTRESAIQHWNRRV